MALISFFCMNPALILQPWPLGINCSHGNWVGMYSLHTPSFTFQWVFAFYAFLMDIIFFLITKIRTVSEQFQLASLLFSHSMILAKHWTYCNCSFWILHTWLRMTVSNFLMSTFKWKLILSLKRLEEKGHLLQSDFQKKSSIDALTHGYITVMFTSSQGNFFEKI